jgi:hypothetical protein
LFEKAIPISVDSNLCLHDGHKTRPRNICHICRANILALPQFLNLLSKLQLNTMYHVLWTVQKLVLRTFFPVPIRKNNMFLHFLASTCTLSNWIQILQPCNSARARIQLGVAYPIYQIQSPLVSQDMTCSKGSSIQQKRAKLSSRQMIQALR